MKRTLPTNKGMKFPTEVITPEEYVFLLGYAGNPSTRSGARNLVIFELMYATGLRVSEVCDLDLKDMDLSGRRLVVLKGKGGKRRVVGIPESLMAAMAIYGLFRGTTPGPLVQNRYNERLTPILIRQLVARVARKSGLAKRIHPHGLRHSFATNMANHGAPLRVIQELLGHSSPSTTDRYLAGLTNGEAADYLANL